MRATFAFLLLVSASAAVAADATPKSQFIDRSYVELPKAVGEYRLDEVKYDPEHWYAGVTGAYNLTGAPKQFTINVFVYAQGEGDEARIVEEQIDGVAQGIRLREDYSEIVVGPRENFVVPAPGASGETEPAAAKHGAQVAKPSTDPIVVAAMESAPPTLTVGRRQGYSFRIDGQPVRSVGMVFHRNLFNIKLRITVPASDMEQSEFDAAVDATARALVPAVEIQNFGTCAEVKIALPQEGGDDGKSEAVAVQVIRGANRVMGHRCSATIGEKHKRVRGGYERQEIVFPTGTWKSD